MASLDLSKSFHNTSSFERELGNIEKEKIKKMLLSSVVIHDREKKIHHRTSALTIINQFALSTIQTYGTHLRAFMQRDTAFHVEVLHTIRGSTATASLEQKELSSDLDLVIKCKILPNSFYDYGQFKKFCYAIAYDVLHKILPSKIPGKIINIDALIDKTSGVFKSLYPFIDTSRCVYSLASLVEVNDETKDIDMDITLLFEPQHDLNPAQIPSPVIAKKSKVSPSEHTEERPMYDLDAKSFAHDAVEIVLPTKASRIDILGKMHFSSLFQIPLSDIEHHLVHRNLIILDTKIFKGHCRFFYEITKGRLPLNTVEEEDLELKKSIELLSSSSEIKKSVEILVSFIKGKKKDRSFFENFMINAYIVTQTLLNKIEETLDGRITLIHDQLKMFIDELEHGFCMEGHKYCDIQNPLGVLSKVATINSHFQKSIITFEKMSLGKKFRVSANNELMEGFTVVPSLTFRELFSLLESMQMHPDIYTDLCALHINSYTTPNWAAEDKWKFVYFLRKIEQESLSTEELNEIVSLFSEITPKIVQEKSLITKKTFTQVFLQFFLKHQSAFISKEEDFTLLRILRLATNQKETGLLGIISLMTLPKLPIDDALATDIKECLIQGYQCKKTGFFASYLVEMLNKIITILPEGISPDIVPMIIHAINEQLERKDISASVLFMSKLLLDKDPLALGRTIDFDLCDQLKVDMHEICKTNNTIFDHLSHEGKISVINWSIENQETALLSYCLIKKPMLSIRLLQGYIKKNQEEGLTTIQRLCKDVNIKKLFLIKAT
ncbi:MAG: hypothetical protein FJZ57_07080, partial [Chlamydiae bacterium]|nr:hypothetical protein [Chlamydiota bacterium]